MSELDLRIVQLSVEINGQITTYPTGLQITATGTKYANPIQNECEVVIENLDKETQDYILTESSPFNLNRTFKAIALYAGRESYGTSLIYAGNIVTSYVTQPPDVKLVLKCLTGNFLKGNLVSINLGIAATGEQIAAQVAQLNGWALDYQAENKIVGGYSFSGAAADQIDVLNQFGFMDAYLDDNVLVVKDYGLPLANSIKIVNIDTGMIGIPVITEHGVKIKFLIDNVTKVGGRLRLTSIMFPSLNGDYIIYKLGFELASRDTPFYYTAECKRIIE
jgi:hypothetical protein